MTPLVEASDLAVARGARCVLQNLSFHFAAGEFVALLGLNGAGKSTLLETLAGLLPGYQGCCRIRSRELRSWTRNELSRVLSFLPQSAVNPAGFDVRHVVAMGRYPYSGGWSESPEDRDAIEQAIDACQCGHLVGRRFGTLSGGERQRVLLAAALAQDAAVLALDEPSAHADLPLQARMFQLLADRAAAGTLCIAAMHDINFALTFAHRVVLLSDGAIVYDGPSRGLLESPAFVRTFGSEIQIAYDTAGNPLVAYRRRAS